MFFPPIGRSDKSRAFADVVLPAVYGRVIINVQTCLFRIIGRKHRTCITGIDERPAKKLGRAVITQGGLQQFFGSKNTSIVRHLR